ncbi:Neurochondrin-domain-containing protein [Xylariales sp. PMI_506]|nr:Neurochondrin-domain-containing protein [Xylariales sp. PMI_506]
MESPGPIHSSHGQAEDVPGATGPQAQTLEQIQQLLKAKDDTSRFVGLALLKSTLDTSTELQSDPEVITSLWDCISAKFLDRLLRTGSKPGAKQADAKEMLQLAASVIYTFSLLLPDELKSHPKLLGRIPLLVSAVLESAGETTEIILKTLLMLTANSLEARTAFAAVEDWTPLIEVAPTQPMVLSILAWSWVYGQPEDTVVMSTKIDQAISALVASYKGTDGVTLIDFIGKILSRLNHDLLPKDPKWLSPLLDYIQNLAKSKPTAAGREAYTNCVANLLVTYSDPVTNSLFANDSNSEKPWSYLFINLILIDIRSTLPTLLAKLNTPEYPTISERITSALIICSFYINFLIRLMEQAELESSDTLVLPLPADLIIKLRGSIGDTLSVVVEYLRDRWDAAVAGVQGLHPEARYGKSHTFSGSHMTLTWDSKHEPASEDRLLMAALRVLGDWLREDDGELLKKEAIGLIDLLIDLYKSTTAERGELTTRALVLGVLDGLLEMDDGIQALLEHDGWSILCKDLLVILDSPPGGNPLQWELGQHIVAILVTLLGNRSTTPDEWLDLVTGVAAYQIPAFPGKPPLALQRLWGDALRLATILLSRAPPGVKGRFVHSADAVAGIIKTVREIGLDEEVAADLKDVKLILASDDVFGSFRS